MSNAATALGTRLGARLGTSVGVESTPESRLLARLATITGSVWFDPAWDPGVVREDDSGTWRITAVQSRPIYTQYTVASPSLPIAPAEAFGPAGKRILSFGGAHYLSGAAGLAALLQGSASYSELHLASRTVGGATQGRWCASLNAASPDNKIMHDCNTSNVSLRQRNQAGALTQNTGDAVTVTTVHTWASVYNGSDYDAWLDGVAETLSGGGANTRAPASLDDIIVGARRSGGAPGSFWTGLQAGLVVCPGTVLSTSDRVALQSDLAAYYGY